VKRFQYHEPKTVKEACRLLSKYNKEASILAGGTDLVIKMKNSAIRPKHVVNIKMIEGLNLIAEDKDGYRLGTATTLVQIIKHSGLHKRLSILSNSARSIGSNQVRNVATIGGNICNGAPSADMVPGLLVLDARVRICGVQSDRIMPLEDFFTGPGMVSLQQGELLTELIVPFPAEASRQIYLKHGPRRAMDCAMVGVAVLLELEPSSGLCQKARIALGAVAPTPIRAKRTEQLITGKKVNEISPDLVAETVCREVDPITDVRATADYRSEMVSILTLRAIQSLTTNT